MMRPSMLHLEPRLLCSVSAVTLAGPLTIGSAWTYASGITVTISGPVNQSEYGQFGFDSLDVQSTNSANSPFDIFTDSTFEALDPKRGLIAYGTSETSASVHEPVDDTYTAPAVIYPPTMVAGKVYHNNYTDIPDHDLSIAVHNTITLESETLQSVTVPAGTFSCYEIVDGQQGTKWIAPGVGLVKQTTTDGDTDMLTAYTIAGDPAAAQLAPLIVKGGLPANIVAGSKSHVTFAVRVKNLGDIAETGSVTTQIVAEGENDNTSVVLGTLTRNLSLNLNGTAVMNVPIKQIPADLNDTYFIEAITTDKLGNILTDTGDQNTVSIGPPAASLDMSLNNAAAPKGNAGPGLFTFTIINSGNIAANETASMQFYGSNTAEQFPATLTGATLLFGAPFTVHIGIGQTRNDQIHITAAQLEMVAADQYVIFNLVAVGADGVLDETVTQFSK